MEAAYVLSPAETKAIRDYRNKHGSPKYGSVDPANVDNGGSINAPLISRLMSGASVSAGGGGGDPGSEPDTMTQLMDPSRSCSSWATLLFLSFLWLSALCITGVHHYLTLRDHKDWIYGLLVFLDVILLMVIVLLLVEKVIKQQDPHKNYVHFGSMWSVIYNNTPRYKRYLRHNQETVAELKKLWKRARTREWTDTEEQTMVDFSYGISINESNERAPTKYKFISGSILGCRVLCVVVLYLAVGDEDRGDPLQNVVAPIYAAQWAALSTIFIHCLYLELGSIMTELSVMKILQAKISQLVSDVEHSVLVSGLKQKISHLVNLTIDEYNCQVLDLQQLQHRASPLSHRGSVASTVSNPSNSSSDSSTIELANKRDSAAVGQTLTTMVSLSTSSVSASAAAVSAPSSSLSAVVPVAGLPTLPLRNDQKNSDGDEVKADSSTVIDIPDRVDGASDGDQEMVPLTPSHGALHEQHRHVRWQNLRGGSLLEDLERLKVMLCHLAVKRQMKPAIQLFDNELQEFIKKHYVVYAMCIGLVAANSISLILYIGDLMQSSTNYLDAMVSVLADVCFSIQILFVLGQAYVINAGVESVSSELKELDDICADMLGTKPYLSDLERKQVDRIGRGGFNVFGYRVDLRVVALTLSPVIIAVVKALWPSLSLPIPT